MSVWGHIAGIIRVDGMSLSLTDDRAVVPTKAPVDIGIMTPDYEYDDIPKTREQADLYYKERERQWQAAQDSGIPMGSEGSITWEWLAHKRGSHQYDGRYIISGDLRDYEDAQPVIDWLIKIKKEIEAIPGCWLRQVSVQIEIEGQEPIFVGLDENGEIAKYTVAANGVLLYAKN